MRIVISWLTRLALPIKENLCPFSLLQTWLLFNYFGALRVTTIFSFSLFLLSSCYFSSSNYLLGNSIFHKCFFSGCVYMFAYSKTWFNCGVLQSTSKSTIWSNFKSSYSSHTKKIWSKFNSCTLNVTYSLDCKLNFSTINNNNKIKFPLENTLAQLGVDIE